jgi:hypothetical protein
MSGIAHRPSTPRASVQRRAVLYLVGVILVASVAIVLAMAIAGSDADRTTPAASPAHGAPSQAENAPSAPTHGATPCCGHRR